MFIEHIVLNQLTWSRLGTKLEIGFRYSASDGQEDDWVLCTVDIVVSNDSIEPCVEQILAKFDRQIKEAVHAEANKNE